MSTIAEDAHRPPVRRLSEAERRAIVAHYTSNGSILQTSQHFGVHRNTVSTIVNSVRKLANVSESVLAPNWRETMRPKAIQAVTAGLEHDDDPYKQANVGIQVLKGLGDFKNDAELNIVTLVSNAPAGVDDIAASCRTLETHASPEVEATTVGLSESPTPSTDPKI